MPTLNIEGRKVKVDDSFLSLSPADQQKTVEEIAAKLGVGQQASSGRDTSVGSTFQYAFDQPIENLGTTIQSVGKALGSDTIANAGQGVRDFTSAPQNYQPYAGNFMNPQEGDKTFMGLGYEYLPRAMAEQTGQLAGSLAARGVGAAVGGAVGGAPGAAVGAFAGPALFEFVQQLGPIALKRAQAKGLSEPDWTDWTAAAGGAGLSGALNAIGIKGLGKLNSTLLGNMAKEGFTEAGQSVIQQGAETLGTPQGLSVSPKQAIGEGILGAGTAGFADTTIKVAGGAKNAVSEAVNAPPKVMDQNAAISVAKRLVQESQSNDINLKDVNRTSENGAQLALDNVHTAISEDIKATWNEIKGAVGDNVDSLDKIVQKAQANAARRDAANKVKNMVADHEIEAIKNLELKDRNGDPIKLGDLDIGQKLIFNLKESNELTRMARQGPKGGVSQITDKFNPLGSGSTYQGGDGVVNALSLLGAIGTGGMTTAAQVGVVGAGRAIDAMTGRRSRVQRFVDSYANQDLTNAPDQVALKSYFEEKAAAQKALADAKSEAERQKAQAKLDAIAAKEAKLKDAQAQKEALAKQRADEKAQALQMDTVKKTMAFQKRMQAQKAQEETSAQRQQAAQEQNALDTVQTTMDFQSKMQRQKAREEVAAQRAASRQPQVNDQAVFNANMARVLRVARVKEALLKQKERALAAEAKAKTSEQKKQAAEAKKTVEKREAKVDAIVKTQKVVLKAQQKQQKKAQDTQEPGFSKADLAKLGLEGGPIRNKTREQRGTEKVQGMERDALQAADSYPDKTVGAKVRIAIETLGNNMRGQQNNEKRKAYYENLIKEVGDQHKDFVQRYVRGLAYYFDR